MEEEQPTTGQQIVEEQPVKEAVIYNKKQTREITTTEINEVVEKIIVEWNKHVELIQNNTIKLCMMIKGITSDFPKESIKDILNKVRQHPDLKQFVSIDRIWQGMRLINRRPELIEYINSQEDNIETQIKPYKKKDGSIFWEYYFELEKHGLNPLEREMLEKEGIDERWTCKQLREHIQDRKDELVSKGNPYIKKGMKEETIGRCITILKTLPLDKVINAEKLLFALRNQDTSDLQRGIQN